MQMYMQWRKDGGSTSSSKTFILPRLPRFEKLNLYQLQFYIEAETITQCSVCRNCKNTTIIRSSAGKERFF